MRTARPLDMHIRLYKIMIELQGISEFRLSEGFDAPISCDGSFCQSTLPHECGEMTMACGTGVQFPEQQLPWARKVLQWEAGQLPTFSLLAPRSGALSACV